MADIFGIDIAGIVADSIADAGNLRPGTLTHVVKGTRTAGNLTAGTNPTTTNHTFQGFVERKVPRRPGQVGGEPHNIVTLLGATINPVTVPAINDKVVIDGSTYLLFALLSRDPAAAVYEFMTED